MQVQVFVDCIGIGKTFGLLYPIKIPDEIELVTVHISLLIVYYPILHNLRLRVDRTLLPLTKQTFPQKPKCPSSALGPKLENHSNA